MNDSWNGSHIPDSDLLLARGGELSPVRAAEICDHLAECPSCRMRDARLQQTMADVVQAQHREFDRQLPPMPASTSKLRARLAEGPREARSLHRLEWAAAAVLLVGIGAAWSGWLVHRDRTPETEI